MTNVETTAAEDPQTDGAETDERLLVLAALVGDLEAFEALVDRYRGAITLVAQHIVGSRAAAEDIAQDTLVIAFQSLPDLDDPARFGAWLRAIARHRAFRTAGRSRRDEATPAARLDLLREDQQRIAATTVDPALLLQQQAERDALWTAFGSLPAEYQEVLYLHHCEAWPLAQITAFVDAPETTIKGRLYRAREALRRAVAGQHIDRLHEEMGGLE